MNWLFFALISISSISIANLFQKLAMKNSESDPVTSSILFQFIVTFFTAIYAALKGFTPPLQELIFPYITISTLFYALGTLSFFNSIKIIEASEMTILSGFGAVVTIIAAYMFLGERLSVVQLLGVLLILISVVAVKYEKGGVKFNKGVLLALLGTSFYGLAVTSDAYVIKAYEAISYTPVISFLPGVLLCAMYPKKAVALVRNIKNSINKNLGVYGFLYSIQAVSYYLALESGALASQMNAFFKVEIVLTVILASIYLKERKNIGKKIIGALLATLGVILIA